jgi:hypothetical protein
MVSAVQGMSRSYHILVCTIRPETRAVCTISSSPSSFGSWEVTVYLDSSPAIGWIRMTTNGGSRPLTGNESACPSSSM